MPAGGAAVGTKSTCCDGRRSRNWQGLANTVRAALGQCPRPVTCQISPRDLGANSLDPPDLTKHVQELLDRQSTLAGRKTMEQTIVEQRSPGQQRSFSVRYLNVGNLSHRNRSQQRVVASAPDVVPKVERKAGVRTVCDLKDLPRRCQGWLNTPPSGMNSSTQCRPWERGLYPPTEAKLSAVSGMETRPG